MNKYALIYHILVCCRITDNKFLCGPGTRFNQRSRTCQVRDMVDCSLSTSLYYLNSHFKLESPGNGFCMPSFLPCMGDYNTHNLIIYTTLSLSFVILLNPFTPPHQGQLYTSPFLKQLHPTRIWEKNTGLSEASLSLNMCFKNSVFILIVDSTCNSF